MGNRLKSYINVQNFGAFYTSSEDISEDLRESMCPSTFKKLVIPKFFIPLSHEKR